ncbi:MAG: PQQ-binding-like beta-propeller repeat protein [Verrucomicrobiales bacterium]
MRIVEYQKDKGNTAYRVTRGVAIVAAIFAFVTCLFLIANNTRLKSADPIHSPALETLMAKLHENPKDQALREEIRELDYLARAAFFTSQRFTQVGIYLVLISLAVMVVAFRISGNFNEAVPYPDADDPKDNLVKEAYRGRRAVGIAGLVLMGFALALAIPWKSTLDETSPPAAATADATADAKTAAGNEAERSAVAESPAPADIPVIEMATVTREEMLANWASFRGADGGRVCGSEGLPIAWDGASGEGVLWKTEIPKPGFSSPIVWKNRVFLTGADEKAQEVYALDSESGALLWQKEITGIPGSPAEPPEVTGDTGFAAPTMASNGTLVFAIFCTGDIVALDFEGNQIWGRNLGVPKNNYGHASSLALYQDTVLVQFDHDGEGGGKFLALDAGSGKTRWEVAREFPASWSSPLLVDTDEGPQVILATDPFVISYDPATGDELWRVECLEAGEVAPTPVLADGVLYVAADFVAFTAIDIKTREILWQLDSDIPGVSTPVVYGDFLIYGLADGALVCRDVGSGDEIWYEFTDDGFYASPLLVGDRVYLIDRSGKMHIFPASGEFKPLGAPTLGEEAVATPAVVDNSLYIRGVTHLFRIGS